MATIVCLECSSEFEHENAWRATCSDACRLARRAKHSRMREESRVRSPREILQMRARNARWAAEHRSCTNLQPWLAGAPPYESHFPGFAQHITFRPAVPWLSDLRHVRGLHAALTGLLDVPHRDRFPNFTLFPTVTGWGVYWFRTEAASLPSQARLRVFDTQFDVSFGPRLRVRAPIVTGHKRMRVRIEALTPVCVVASGRSVAHTQATGPSLISALATEFPNRLTQDTGWAEDFRRDWASWVRPRTVLEIVESATEPAHVQLAGKFGQVHGWTGSVTADVNATTRWLLGAAERVGLGSRVGFGFGAIRVKDV